LSLSDAHDQRPPATQERVVIYIASVDQRHGFPHVLQSPWEPLRDLVRGNVVTALKNARLDALERQFRSTDVQVIKEDSKPEFLSLANEVDFGGVRYLKLPSESPRAPSVTPVRVVAW
jgi:hypothetical protein